MSILHEFDIDEETFHQIKNYLNGILKARQLHASEILNLISVHPGLTPKQKIGLYYWIGYEAREQELRKKPIDIYNPN